MSVWQTPQPATAMITSSGESSPRAASAHSNWPLATVARPLLVTGTESALCADRTVVIGGLHTHKFERAFEKRMSQAYLGLWIEEVIAITPACDLMAGEHVEEPSRVGRSQGFRKAQEPGGSGQQPLACEHANSPVGFPKSPKPSTRSPGFSSWLLAA